VRVPVPDQMVELDTTCSIPDLRLWTGTYWPGPLKLREARQIQRPEAFTIEPSAGIAESYYSNCELVKRAFAGSLPELRSLVLFNSLYLPP
jgi:hypothetical protein